MKLFIAQLDRYSDSFAISQLGNEGMTLLYLVGVIEKIRTVSECEEIYVLLNDGAKVGATRKLDNK